MRAGSVLPAGLVVTGGVWLHPGWAAADDHCDAGERGQHQGIAGEFDRDAAGGEAGDAGERRGGNGGGPGEDGAAAPEPGRQHSALHTAASPPIMKISAAA
jgi:hypothetical protein